MTFQKTINIQGRLVDLSTPRVMGIINVTPDSFYPGSRKTDLKAILYVAEKMLNEGADFLDIGGYSSRPGAEDISEKEELDRILPPISEICRRFPEAVISVDTFRARVGLEAVEAGAHIVNDISGGDLDVAMMKTVAGLGVPYVVMHMRGTPQTMREHKVYDHLLREVAHELAQKVAKARSFGIKDLIIDPGFGFAKTGEQNYYLLNNVDYLKQLNLPLLVGVSRKSMIYKLLNSSSEEALNGTTVLNTVALLKGASILRVHDVREAVEAIKLITHLQN